MSSIDHAIRFIKKSWKEGKTLKEIAHDHRLDPGNLDREFRKAEGITVKQYVDARRKRAFERALRRGGRFGYEIGTLLGFKNDLAFYRWVRRAYGKSFRSLLRNPRPPSKEDEAGND
jgi:methylphosphotriester-DNA--protein-cysteine methyltransferase